jgi:hypothetical protein
MDALSGWDGKTTMVMGSLVWEKFISLLIDLLMNWE